MARKARGTRASRVRGGEAIFREMHGILVAHSGFIRHEWQAGSRTRPGIVMHPKRINRRIPDYIRRRYRQTSEGKHRKCGHFHYGQPMDITQSMHHAAKYE